jgi:hypothetical protein
MRLATRIASQSTPRMSTIRIGVMLPFLDCACAIA